MGCDVPRNIVCYVVLSVCDWRHVNHPLSNVCFFPFFKLFTSVHRVPDFSFSLPATLSDFHPAIAMVFVFRLLYLLLWFFGSRHLSFLFVFFPFSSFFFPSSSFSFVNGSRFFFFFPRGRIGRMNGRGVSKKPRSRIVKRTDSTSRFLSERSFFFAMKLLYCYTDITLTACHSLFLLLECE